MALKIFDIDELWACEECKAVYSNRGSAVDCERSHGGN